MCWLNMGRHVLVKNPRTGRHTCQFCGGDGDRALRESDEFQQAWTEYHEADFYGDIDVDRESVPNPMKLVVPRFLRQMIGRG